MACSKLFSGDLPELINEIIQYFHYDYKTLHSCIFVNRLWCRLAIPLLWEDPFSIKFPKNYYFIEIYLNNLNDDDKVKLNEYIIHNELFPLNTLFNYPRFIKHLDAYKVSNSIEKWVKTIMNSTIKEQHSNYSITNANLSLSQIIKLIFWSLILLFIKNEANLHSFKVTTCIGYSNEIIELILQNRNFIYNIKNLALKLDKANDNIIKFLEFLCSNCNSISSLYFPLPSYNNYPIIEKYLSQIIKSQENLKKISFGYGYGCSLYHPLLSLNNLNCSNTLNTIIFYYINFKNINVLSEVFNQLNVLESIHIVYCYHLDSKFIQQINNIIKPFKLKSLFLDGVNYELLEPLMQKSGNYLESFGFYHDGSQKLLQLIIKYCNKIKFLFPIWTNNQFIYLLFNIIENIKQNLNYLSIDHRGHNTSSTILQNLGQILPFKLEYLNLCLNLINTNDLRFFLKNSQNIFIKKLLIKNTMNENCQNNIFPYIKEYIMKKKRIKYLAIREILCSKSEDLFFSKDKVKEFELYGIQVLNYDDFVIDIYSFIIETY
ncbi:uncharacterized protein OCT59_024024 [Rhizophagus irregularis]|uniref:F-box domain-containing protein n=2 Tax=Rhizophagus irregularis (strain DAOM 181602 / DAOM 197198 / MUCL 43194) TaxID=747089 RepID=A0A2H5RVP2_RHIID|nr:hypothetical protein GLOIN_2v1881283 [Rhizophagus irregularis DAOM 181602=DAOM 197198]POG64546.1 hypothetical protein GLOIN_2v1881283 [Rhizophagus irregularis DAOM 181602=DAOM 197198]UZO03620.1 hypothetical protein OCT59_024024 [Rhizophagus irregularis]GET58522.1 hypothetical protein GLOIN_2v1881283 [Rhizophagus irregularis DAOM 181602=DAOM 197198]|eukprot:XP_025171412.1 hypothetical protein GLOIN_2v1881283 [Rhizophagus irregularis DAOM 181602=DAOM 197198]